MRANSDRWTSLALLLGAFAAASFGALLLLVARTQARRLELEHPRGPAQFSAVLGFDKALEGLPANAAVSSGSYIVPRPALDKDMFPCSQCHDNKDLVSKPEPRAKLRDPHENHAVGHGPLWCLSCHDNLNRDKLHLADGTLVDLAEPLRLCAQCHAGKAKDWETGVHGHRTGYWSGMKRVEPCVACHDPHHPHFKSIEPLPAPVRPGARRTSKESP